MAKKSSKNKKEIFLFVVSDVIKNIFRYQILFILVCLIIKQIDLLLFSKAAGIKEQIKEVNFEKKVLRSKCIYSKCVLFEDIEELWEIFKNLEKEKKIDNYEKIWMNFEKESKLLWKVW